ncbi:MAG: sensor histidine kinase [Pseudomonadota bacterium]
MTRFRNAWSTVWAAFLFSMPALSFDLPTVQLEPGKSAPPLVEYVRYTKNYFDTIDYETIRRRAGELESVEGTSIQFGRAASGILFLLKLENVGSKPGRWIFSTDRGSAVMLKIYSISEEATSLRFDSDDFASAKEVLHTYLHYADIVELEPGEERIIAVYSHVEDSAYFPLVLQTEEEFFKDSHLSLILSAGSSAAFLALIVLNLFFYTATGRSEFVWLVIAEFFLLMVILYMVGFLSTYVFYDRPHWGLVFGDVTKYGFVISMLEFSRRYVGTRKLLPTIDLIFRGLISVSVVMIVVQFCSHWLTAETRITLHAINYLIVALSAFILPVVGVYATLRIGWENWPLIVSWLSLALFALYAAVAFSGVVPNLTISLYWIAPVGLIEAGFATLALGLNLRKTQRESMAAKELYAKNLREKLAISEQAARLANEKAAAQDTINDQSGLLHASGHDSKQVLMALNVAAQTLKSDQGKLSIDEVADLLESSTRYLDQIVSSTLTGSRIASSSYDFVALSYTTLADVIKPLEMLYRPLFSKKGLSFSLDMQNTTCLVTDRAMLARAVSNILSNSLKFTDRGIISLKSRALDDTILIEIADTGIGIASELLDKLNCEGDARLKANDLMDGTGSGFRFCKYIIETLRGSIVIAGTVGKGTTVTICLPLCSTEKPCDLSQLQARLPHVLLVDWDQKSDEGKDRWADDASSIPQIGVTYDDSSITRQRLKDGFALVIYKPLYLEHAEHPLLCETNDVLAAT